MNYSPKKTLAKGSVPLVVLVLVNIALSIIKSRNIDIDEQYVWDAALLGYSGIVAFINWLKNFKKKA